MKFFCPNLNCSKQHCANQIVKDGFFIRRSDSKKIQRYKCKNCQTRFSAATFSPTVNQNKRRINHMIEGLLSSGVSMRRIALIVRTTRTTVKRKLDFLSKRAKLRQNKLLEEIKKYKISHIQIDDLITIEHTKLKPLSISIAVDKNYRTILGAQVSKIPAFGHLAKMSVNKYGKRESELKDGLNKLFQKLIGINHPDFQIDSDEHTLYPLFIKKYFPAAKHNTYPSIKGAVSGQGELKKTIHDPLFVINHTCAMFRYGISRLIRRTWNTTKDIQELKKHIDVYINFYNKKLVKLPYKIS